MRGWSVVDDKHKKKEEEGGVENDGKMILPIQQPRRWEREEMKRVRFEVWIIDKGKEGREGRQ